MPDTLALISVAAALSATECPLSITLDDGRSIKWIKVSAFAAIPWLVHDPLGHRNVLSVTNPPVTMLSAAVVSGSPRALPNFSR